MVNDVARAFFEAPARRTICVEFLKKRHMREMEEVRKVLTKAGFKRGKYNPSTYYQEKGGIKARGPTTSPWTVPTSSTRSRRYAGG